MPSSLGEGVEVAVGIANARQMRPGDNLSSNETFISENKTATMFPLSIHVVEEVGIPIKRH